jgi:hypothetical protein
MAGKVAATFTADGVGFEKVVASLEKRVHGLSHKVGHGLTEAFVGLIGAASFGALFESFVRFSDEIEQASKRIGITTDRVQELKKAGRDIGRDLGAFETVFNNLDKGARYALKPGSKQAAAASQLGLTQGDLQNADRDTLMQKMLRGTEGMSDAKSRGLLAEMVGNKNAGWLLAGKEQILSGEGAKASHDEIAKLRAFKDSLEDLTDIIRVGLIPAFTALIDWVQGTLGRTIQGSRTMDEMDKEAQLIYMQKHGGQLPGTFTTDLLKQSSYQVTLAAISANPLANDAEKAAKIKKLQEGFISNMYGDDVWQELNKTFKPSERASIWDNLKAAQEARQKAREREDAEMKGPAGRVAPVSTTKESKTLPLDSDLKNGSNNLSIGGTLGIDPIFRLTRLNQEQIEWLKKIAANTDPSNADENIFGVGE